MGSYAVEIQVTRGKRFTRNWRRFRTEAQAADYAGSRQVLAHAPLAGTHRRPYATRIVTTGDDPNTTVTDHDAYYRERCDARDGGQR